MKRTILTILLFLPASAAFSQTWFKVASESQALSLTLPAGTTYRMGSAVDNKWSPSEMVAAVTTFIVYSSNLASVFPDPAPGELKELDILETAVAQTVTLTDSSVTPATVTPTTVPALSAAAGQQSVLTFLQNSISPIAVNNITVNSVPLPPALIFANGVPPISVNITITDSNGVTVNLSCAVGGKTAADGVQLNCAPVFTQ